MPLHMSLCDFDIILISIKICVINLYNLSACEGCCMILGLYTGKCATCVKHAFFLKRMVNVRLTHGKRVNRVTHV